MRNSQFWELLLEAGAEHDRELQALRDSQMRSQTGLLHLGEEVLEHHSPPQACLLVQSDAEHDKELFDLHHHCQLRQQARGNSQEIAKSWQAVCMPANPFSKQLSALKAADDDIATGSVTFSQLQDIDGPSKGIRVSQSSACSMLSVDVDGTELVEHGLSVDKRTSLNSVLSQLSVYDELPTSDPRIKSGIYSVISEGSLYPNLFELKPLWLAAAKQASAQDSVRSRWSIGGHAARCDDGRTSRLEQIGSRVWDTLSSAGWSGPDEGAYCKCVSHPSSRFRVAWDVFSIIFVAYDFVYVPLQMFPLAGDYFAEMFEWFPRVFWTVDVLYSFFVGYHHQGEVIMSWPSIVRHYSRTWFTPDIIIVSSDWTFYFMVQHSKGESRHIGNMARILRLSRNMRTIRLLRLAKLGHFMKELQDRIDSEKISTYVRVVCILVLLLAINHVVACFWYGISVWSGERFRGFKHWVEQHGYSDASVAFLYCASLHWSLCQFTPAPNPIHPHNMAESIFAILVVLTAMIVFSSFVSQITSANAQMRQKRSDANKQLWLLRRFLKKSGVSTPVLLRVQRYLEHETEQQLKLVREQDIQVLNLLPNTLRNELTLELNSAPLERNEYFRFLKNSFSRKVYLKIWHKVLTRVPLANGDALFFRGEPAGGMFCLTSGLLQYKRKEDLKVADVHPGMWICEGELWTYWVTVGDLRAATESDLIKVDCTRLAKGIQAIPSAFRQSKVFGMQFVNALNDLSTDDITDLEVKDISRVPFHRS